MGEFERTHDRFLDRLDQSHAAVWRIAMWLSSLGANVQINGLHKAPTRADASRFSDLGDLEIMQRAEVKQLGAAFTCRDDWPFTDFLVCNKAAFDRALRKPRFFYYLNRDRTHVACLDVSKTAAKWVTVTRRDKTYDDIGGKPEEVFYCCQPELATYHSIDDTR